MYIITNAVLVMRDHYIPEAYLAVKDGLIAAFGRMRDLENDPAKAVSDLMPEFRGDLKDVQVIDADGLFVGPGFIDIHSHAGGVHSFMQEPLEAAEHHLAHGTTTVLATIGSTQDQLHILPNIRKCMMEERGCNIGGVYMEGPYFNSKYGAHKFLLHDDPIVREAYMPLIEVAKGLARVWMIGPEMPGILSFVQDLKEAMPDLVLAVGHSEAAPDEIERLIPYGLSIGTHHTNATGTLVRYPECRGICVDEAVNYNRSIYAELICDENGIHVDPYMLRLIRKIKGEDRIILISDATAYNVPKPAKGYEYVNDLNFDIEGEIAGTRLTLDCAARNMMKHTGASIVDVFRYASYNPSRAVKLTDRGEIAVGKRADLVFVDYRINVNRVIVGGIIKI